MDRITRLSGAAALVALFVGAIGCASTPPPQDLVLARDAYQRARASDTARYAPVQLHTARQALDLAEQSCSENCGSTETQDRAYMALRRIQLADAQARIMKENEARVAADNQVRLTQAEMATRAQGQLQQTQQQLEQERSARMDAEKREQAALDQLRSTLKDVRQEARGTVITLAGNVLFPAGKATLLPGAKSRLDRIATALKAAHDRQVVIEGNADATGSDEVNKELSTRRAESVRDYLVSKGANADHVRAVGLGSSKPIADNATPAGRAMNRRVEIVIAPAPTMQPRQQPSPQPQIQPSP